MSSVPSKSFSQVAIIATYLILIAMLGYGLFLGKDKVNFSGSPLRLSETEITDILFTDTIDDMWFLIERRYKNLATYYDPFGQQSSEWDVRSNSKVKFSVYKGTEFDPSLNVLFMKVKDFDRYLNYIDHKYPNSSALGTFIFSNELQANVYPITQDNPLPSITFYLKE